MLKISKVHYVVLETKAGLLVLIIILIEVQDMEAVVHDQNTKQEVIHPPEALPVRETQITILKDTNIGADVTDMMTRTGQGQVREVHLLTQGEIRNIMMKETITVIMSHVTDTEVDKDMMITVMMRDMIKEAIGQGDIGQGQGALAGGEDNCQMAYQYIIPVYNTYHSH